MIVTIQCPDCKEHFGVVEIVIKNGHVRYSFSCPYEGCGHKFSRGDALKLVGITGGVNIGGSAYIGGDVVGGDLHKRG